MESLDNLMDFDKTVRNISPNSKFMEPLIKPVSTPLRVRTVSDPARLSLDNNPFDKALREIALKAMEDDPFEKVLKASLSKNQTDTKGNELGNPTILVNERDLFYEQNGKKTNSIASPSIFNIIPECLACHCKIENRTSAETSCLCSMNISANEPSDTFQSSGSSIGNSTRSILNRGIRYSSSEMTSMEKLNSTSGSRHSSILNKGFMEGYNSRSDSEDFLLASAKNRSKSAYTSANLVRANTFTVECHLRICDEADLNVSVFEEADEIANSISQMKIPADLESRESSVEDLLSVEPVWSDVLSDNDAEKEPEVKTPLESNDLVLSNEATPEAKKLLNDVKELLESKEIQKKALDDLLCRVSHFCDSLKLKNENQQSSVDNNMNDVSDIKMTPSKLLLSNSAKNIPRLKMIKNRIPQFLECLQKSSDSKFMNELITSLRILQSDKLCTTKEILNASGSKLKTPKNTVARIKRSNSVNSQNYAKQKFLNKSFEYESIEYNKQSPHSSKTAVNKKIMSKKTLNTDKTANDKAANDIIVIDKAVNKTVTSKAMNNKTANDKMNKPGIQNTSLIPSIAKPKLRPNKLMQSASKIHKPSLTNDSKLDLKTSTPNTDLYYHNGAFVFSTPSKHET